MTKSIKLFLLQLQMKMKYVDRATVFISHAWGYKFKDVLEALMTYNFPPDTYLWFDLFSNILISIGGRAHLEMPFNN